MTKAILAVGLGGVSFLIISMMVLRKASTRLYLFKRLAAQRTGRQRPRLASSNELAVLLCGSGSPLPDPERAGPCALVAAGDRFL
jgi:ribonuclease Z